MKMYTWHVLAVSLVICWAGQKSVNGEASPVIANRRPVWYHGPISTLPVFQRATGHSHGESRAFPSPIYYAPQQVTPPAKGVTTVSSSTTTTTSTTTAKPTTVREDRQSFDLLKFFDRLKRVTEKYARPSASVGTQKQFNEDAVEEEAEEQEDVGSPIDRNDEDLSESSDNDSPAEAINEGMLIVADGDV